jgi:predicted AAA+ superfamily ATPase
METHRTFERRSASALLAALRDTPVVLLNGPRQSGKSTLAQELVRRGALSTYLTFDSAADLASAAADPDGFVRGLDRPAVIDEVQHVPDLFRAIKLAVDRDRRPGRFLLTGSVDVLLAPRISESLAGRMELHTLWPLSQGEIEGARDRFVEAVFRDELPAFHQDPGTRRELAERIVRGGYPEVVLRPRDRRAQWFASYITAIVQRDIRSLAEIDSLISVPGLLHLLGARVGSLLNAAELSRRSGIPYTTLSRYLSLLEATFILRRIPAWSGGLGQRLLKHPRIFVCDSGLAASLQGVDVERIAMAEPTLIGPLIENFVAMELVKQLGWHPASAHLYHFRSAAGEEVDLVLERGDGKVVGLEVKASASVTEDDLRGLRALASRTGRKFHRGVLLYMGDRSVRFGRGLHAVPLSALWRM